MKTIMTVRQALTQIRADLKADNVSYLSGPRQYETDKGTMYVRNQEGEAEGSFPFLLHIFHLL
jgi:hypothetical protein